MAVARGQFLAYAEKADPFGAIVIYDLSTFRKRRTLLTNDVNSKVYIALDFADTGRQIVGLGGPPEYNLIYWWWEKTRILGTARVGQEVKQVRVCPKDANRIAVCGSGMIRVFRLEDSQLKLEPKSSAKVNEYFDFVCLAWLNEFRMLLGTSQGQIIIWEDGSLVADVLDPAATLSLHSMKVKMLFGCKLGLKKINAMKSYNDFRTFQSLHFIRLTSFKGYDSNFNFNFTVV
jgi:hypothetical protein